MSESLTDQLRDRPNRLVQLAYRVPDLDEGCRQWTATMGVGPFLVRRHMKVTTRHHGQEAHYDHSAAFGQWGPVMVELIQVHAAEPASLAEIAHHDAPGALHHAACFVDDLDATSNRLQAGGMELAFELISSSGIRTHFLDARATLGGLLELYSPNPHLVGLYDMVRQAAEGWDGADPIREL